MKPFQTQEEFVAALSALWDEIFNTPEIVTSVSGAKLIAKFRYTDFPTALFIDISGDTPKYYWDTSADKPFDVEMILSSETAHLFWMEQLNVPLALASRKIVAKGSIQKALKLLPALKPAFALYPVILKQKGRDDLLQKAATVARKKKFRWFNFKKKSGYNLAVLPSFPMNYRAAGEPAACPEPRPPVAPSDIELLKMMIRIRAFEQHLAEAFKNGDLPTEAIHLSIGQEAVAAGVCMNLRHTDYLNTTHRGHGHIIAKGADVQRMMAEIYGKGAGLCKGKGGSMHVTEGCLGILGANGIVGAGYLLALGAGFTIKHHEKTDSVSVVIAGDGSVNQGMFHEAMNMTAVFELPVLVVVENNGYGEFTAIEHHSAVTEVFKRAEAYGVETFRFDGNDAKVVFNEVGRVIEKIRADGKPRLVELTTFRWHGHMEGDQEAYRRPEEKKQFAAADPIKKLTAELVETGVLSDSDAAVMRSDIEKEIADAVQFARAAAWPEPEELTVDIYSPDDRSLYSGSFDIPGGAGEMSVSQAINSALAQEMRRDDRVFLWGEDVTLGGYFNVTEGLVEEFGAHRIIDTPISENGFVGGAVGAAMTGMRPVAEILFADFLTCCMDPIMNQAAKLRYMTGGQVSVPLVIRTPLGSGIGMAAQHSQAMEKFFFGIPGLIVIAPSDAFTAKGLLTAAIRSDNPILFFEHKLLYPEAGKAPDGDYTLPIGKARVVRAGEDVTLVTFLLGVGIAREAADQLARVGIGVEIIDLATLYPLDTEAVLRSVAKTGHLVTLEEGHFSGSIGSEVISRVAMAGFDLLKQAPRKIAAPECPIPYAKNLENAMLPSVASVVKTIEAMMAG